MHAAADLRPTRVPVVWHALAFIPPPPSDHALQQLRKLRTMPFQLVVITPERTLPNEASTAAALISRGLERLHVRKPGATPAEVGMHLSGVQAAGAGASTAALDPAGRSLIPLPHGMCRWLLTSKPCRCLRDGPACCTAATRWPSRRQCGGSTTGRRTDPRLG